MSRGAARDLRRTRARDDHSGKSVSDHLQTFREQFSRFQDSLSSNLTTRESDSDDCVDDCAVTLAASALQASRSQFFTVNESFLV